MGRQRVAPGARYDALVLDAGSRQSLATVRSLGRAGLRVAAAECYAECRPDLPVAGFRSRHTDATFELPSYAEDDAGFADAVCHVVRRHPIRVVIPASDGAIAALRPRRTELAAAGARLALADDSALDVANDKQRTLAAASEVGIRTPRSHHVPGSAALGETLEALPLPLVLKPTTSWAPRSPVRLQPVDVMTRDEAVAVVQRFRAAGAGTLAQEWIGGRREGVTLFVVAGSVRAAFAHAELRTTPALGGASVVRESIPLPDDLYLGAVRLVRRIGLEGLCGVEFRRDLTGAPRLMEINARLAGPVEIAARCGVDLPLMLYRWALGQSVPGVAGYRTGVRMRWLRGDMRWLRDNAARAGRVDSVPAGRAGWRFWTEFLRTPRLDGLDLGDLAPFGAELAAITAGVRRTRAPHPAGRTHSHVA